MFLFLIIFQFKYSYSQVIWKSDGTIIGPDGETKRKSYGLRFQEQIKNPTLEWPKASLYGDNPKNYFGNNIFGSPRSKIEIIKTFIIDVSFSMDCKFDAKFSAIIIVSDPESFNCAFNSRSVNRGLILSIIRPDFKIPKVEIGYCKILGIIIETLSPFFRLNSFSKKEERF